MKNKILVTAPVHQSKKVFVEYLDSINHLIIPDDTEIHKYFYIHNSPDLIPVLNEKEYEVVEDSVDFKTDKLTHEWKEDNFNIVSKMRTWAFQYATSFDFTHIFSVDSDVILHPLTLSRLLERGKDVISEIYWTEFLKDSGNLMPNVWDVDAMQYDSKKRGMERFKLKGLYECGGTGACTLIKRKVFSDEYVNYYPIKNVSFSSWEDRAFCIKASIRGYEIWCDTTLPARHLYRDELYEQYVKEKNNV